MTHDEKKKNIDQDEEGSDGVAGEVRFRYKDAMSIDPRDDALPLPEANRLLAIHKDIHKSYVDKQKQTRKERKLLKEGRNSLTSRQSADVALQAGVRGGRSSPYKKHPISNKAQFSGVDRQISSLPTENIAETNEQQRNELENRNELRHRNVPQFNPKLRPY